MIPSGEESSALHWEFHTAAEHGNTGELLSSTGKVLSSPLPACAAPPAQTLLPLTGRSPTDLSLNQTRARGWEC